MLGRQCYGTRSYEGWFPEADWITNPRIKIKEHRSGDLKSNLTRPQCYKTYAIQGCLRVEPRH